MYDFIFINSDAFVALNNPRSVNHEKAVAWVRSMLSETIGLCTSMLVIAESTSVLKKTVGFTRARRFLELIKNPGIQVLEDNKEIQEQAWQLFVKKEKVPLASFADFWKVAIMHYYGIMKIFTFEQFFDQLEVVRIPKGKSRMVIINDNSD